MKGERMMESTKRVPRVAVCAAVLAALAAGLLLGQEAPKPLSLPEAIAIAERNNPGLAAARQEARAASETARAASRFWLPVVSLDADWDRTDVPARVFAQKLNRGELAETDLAIAKLNAPASDPNLETSVGLGIPIDVFGAMRAGARAARAGAEAEDHRAEGVRQDLGVSVTETFYQVFAADRALAAARKSLEAARSLAQELASRAEAGAALEADVLRARTRQRQREVGEARAQAEAALARARFRALLGWPAGRQVNLEAPDGATDRELDLETWLERARKRRPELAMAAAGRAASDAAARRERLSGLPNVSLVGSYQDDRATLSRGNRGGAIALLLHWNVFEAARPARIAAAEANAAAAAAREAATESESRIEVETRWRDLAVERLRAASSRANRAEADEVFRVTRERWREGKATVTDLLDAESAAASAAAAEAEAAAGVATAQAALRRAAGEM
jgi:outer membrane protein